MTRYVLVTPESLARAEHAVCIMRSTQHGWEAHLAVTTSILVAHPREATDALFAVMEAARDVELQESSYIGRDDPVVAVVPPMALRRLRGRLAALREHIAQEDGS